MYRIKFHHFGTHGRWRLTHLSEGHEKGKNLKENVQKIVQESVQRIVQKICPRICNLSKNLSTVWDLVDMANDVAKGCENFFTKLLITK